MVETSVKTSQPPDPDQQQSNLECGKLPAIQMEFIFGNEKYTANPKTTYFSPFDL